MLGFIEWFILLCIAIAIIIIGARWIISIAEIPQPLRLMIVLFMIAILIAIIFNYFPAMLPRGRYF